MEPIIFVGLIIILCAALDRVIGWGGWGRSKPLTAGIIALGALLYYSGVRTDPSLMAIPVFASIMGAVAFIIWRTPAWKMFGGSLDADKSQLLGTFFRHSLALAFVSVGFFAGVFNIQLVAPFVVFAAAATGLSHWNHINSVKGKNVNETVEIVRGALLGLAISVGIVLNNG